MAEKVIAKYIGPGHAILAGKAIYPGEARKVTEGQLRQAQAHHPNGFVIAGQEEVAKEANPLDALTVADIKEAAEVTEDVAYLQKLLEMEQAGQARKTAISAIADRIAELQAPPPPTIDPENPPDFDESEESE